MSSSRGWRPTGALPRVVAVAAVVALLAGGISVVVALYLRGDDVVVLESANAPGDHPFLDGSTMEAVVGGAPVAGAPFSGDVFGDAPGLFAGQGHEVCDPARIGAASGPTRPARPPGPRSRTSSPPRLPATSPD